MSQPSGGTNHVGMSEERSHRIPASGTRRALVRLRALLTCYHFGQGLQHLRLWKPDDSMLAPDRAPSDHHRRMVTQHDPRLRRQTRKLQPVRLAVGLLSCLTVGFGVAAYPRLITASPSAPPRDAPEGCRRELLTHRPGWTLSGAWSPDGETLLVVDILHNQILRYSQSGRSLGTLPELTERTLENFFPSVVKAQDEGDTVLELSAGRIVTLDSHGFAIRAKHDIFAEALDGAWSVRSLFLWHPAGRDLLAASDLKDLAKPDQDKAAWKTAFVRIPLTDPSKFSPLQSHSQDISITDQEREFYQLGNPYLTALGRTGYLLRMAAPVRIYENPPDTAILNELSSYSYPDPLPDLPPFTRLADIPAVLGAVEASSMPVGLFAWNQRLYVITRLARQPETVWQVTSIDPSTGLLHGTATIPLAAAHITVIPGPKRWAFLEKGHAYGPGDQLTKSAFFVPSSRFANDLQGDICE